MVIGLVGAGAAGGVADFVVGVIVGALAGFMVRPVAEFVLARREWTEASRQAHLEDEVLARMERDLKPPVVR